MKTLRQGTQKREILEHLYTNGSISGLEAVLEYYIMDLAGVVRDIKNNLGVSIASVSIKKTNKNGRKISFVRYTLDSSDKNTILVKILLGIEDER